MSTAARTVVGGAFALSLLLVLMIAWDAYCAELRLEVRVQQLEAHVHALKDLQTGGTMTKIPESSDLSALEQAVWAAEYVRARAASMYEAQPPEPLRTHDIEAAIDHANYAVDDLRRVRELR
jgi:hypothetical protein